MTDVGEVVELLHVNVSANEERLQGGLEAGHLPWGKAAWDGSAYSGQQLDVSFFFLTLYKASKLSRKS